MKRKVLACLISFSLLSCGGGKHEPEIKDSRLEHPDSMAGTDSARNDSANGASANRTDTSHSARHNPQ